MRFILPLHGDSNEISSSELDHPSFAENYEHKTTAHSAHCIPDCPSKSPLVQLSGPFLSIFLQCRPIDYVVPKERDQATAQSEKDAEEKKHTIRRQSHRQTHVATQLNIQKHLKLKSNAPG